MAPHSSTLTWKIPWMEEPGALQSIGLLRVRKAEQLHFHFSLSCIGEGNGNPLQCSCVENLRDEGAWWAAVSGVAQSWTRLKRLSSSSSMHSSSSTQSLFGQNTLFIKVLFLIGGRISFLSQVCAHFILKEFLFEFLYLFIKSNSLR